MTDTQMVKKLVALEPDLDILNIEEAKIKEKISKVIHVSNGKKRVRCIYYNKYTRNVHDKLKPITIKYLDIAGYTTYLKVYKRRFNCSNCSKMFTEENFINGNKKILMDLREYNLSLTYIAEHNNVSDNTIRNVLKKYMKNYPRHIRTLPSVVSFDEFICRESKIEEMIEASNTIDNWLPYIVNSFIDKRLTNGFTEGLNNKIKVIKRIGFGYKTFSFFRLRLLYILNSKKMKNSI